MGIINGEMQVRTYGTINLACARGEFLPRLTEGEWERGAGPGIDGDLGNGIKSRAFTSPAVWYGSG